MGLLSSRPWGSVVYWALGVEAEALAPGRAAAVPVGMVPIRSERIRLAEAFRTRVRSGEDPRVEPASGDVRGAPPLAEVLPEIDRRLEEGVLLVHGEGVVVSFLREAHRRADLRWPSPRVVDTARLLHRLSRRERARPPELPREVPTNLAAARASHGLPPYEAYDPLAGAIATAELFLVLRHALGAATLRDLR